MCRIGVAGKIGDRRVLGGKVLPIREMGFHELKQPAADRDGAVAVSGVTPLGNHSRCGWTVRQLSGGDRKPSMHVRGGERLFGKPPLTRCVALCEIHENRVAVSEHDGSVLEYGDLAEWVESQELRRAADFRRGIHEVVWKLQHP